MRYVDAVRGDLRYAARSLARAPLFTLTVAFMFAVGIGVNGAAASIIDTAFLRKLPVPHPDRIVEIRTGNARVPIARDQLGTSSIPDALDLTRDLADVAQLTAYRMTYVTVEAPASTESAWTALVTGTYFSTLEVRPQLGRVLTDLDATLGDRAPAAVISDRLWRSAFAADPRVLGRRVTMGSAAFTVVGVMPRGFTGTHPEGRTDLWLPYTTEASATGGAVLQNRDARLAWVVGRLAPRATLSQLQTRLDVEAATLRARLPDLDGHVRFRAAMHATLAPIAETPAAFVEFLMVWLVIALLHLVACGNVAGLMLARAAARRREIGVRLCLGASRRRVIALLLTESLALAAIGAAGGVLVADWTTALIGRMQFISALTPGLDARMVAIVVCISVATAVVCGLTPAIEGAATDPIALVRGGTARGGSASQRMSRGLIVGQLAMSLVLLAGAAAMAAAFQRELRGAAGYDSDHVALVSLQLRMPPRPANDTVSKPAWAFTQWSVAREAALARVARVPGVDRVAIADGPPLLGEVREEVRVIGHTYGLDESSQTSVDLVGPGYFATIGARMARGREFTRDDRADPLHAIGGYDVPIVNEAMARYWPSGDAIGKRVSFRNTRDATIVGVVRDLKDVSTTRAIPRVYFPLLESFGPYVSVVVRTRDPASMALRLRPLLADLATDPPVARTLADVRENATMVARVSSVALSVCSAMALLLSAVGLYALVSMWVAERRREIGIRVALGARAAHIHAVLLGGAGRLVALGAALGTVGAVAALRALAAWLGPVMPLSLGPMAAALAALGTAAGIAAFVPSLRAARVHPAEVLRSE